MDIAQDVASRIPHKEPDEFSILMIPKRLFE